MHDLWCENDVHLSEATATLRVITVVPITSGSFIPDT